MRILTACILFKNRALDDYDEVNGGEGQLLPDYVNLNFLRICEKVLAL